MDILQKGSKGALVTELQDLLSRAGYRIVIDGDFGPATDKVVRQFQVQHEIGVDGKVGPATYAWLLKTPAEVVVKTALPLLDPVSGFPHDDTASLIRFYGDPRGGSGGDASPAWKAANVMTVICPWPLRYDGKPWNHPIQLHKRCAPAFARAFAQIWDAAGHDVNSPVLRHLRDFSGSGNLRSVRGSSRISTHGFWAAIDWDAEHLPMGKNVPSSEMPQVVIDAFKAQGLFWGGDYVSRKDAMHVQAAHE